MENSITVSMLESLMPSVPIVWWQDGIPVRRVDVFDDCIVYAVELDRGKLCVYVGERL